MRKWRRLAVATTTVVFALAAAAPVYAGEGSGTSASQGSNSFGNAVSSGATPQPSGPP